MSAIGAYRKRAIRRAPVGLMIAGFCAIAAPTEVVAQSNSSDQQHLSTNKLSAQERAQEPDRKSVKELGSVSVTAERRVDELQKVPVAVTALDEEELERRQITTTSNISGNVPNVYGTPTTGVGSTIVWFMRGIGTVQSAPTMDPAVGTYIDGIYLSKPNANQIALLDVQQIEVLRGPQGVQFGRNTIGGAINIITHKPDATPMLSISARTGSYGLGEIKASIGGRIATNILGRFSAFANRSDGWLKSATRSGS